MNITYYGHSALRIEAGGVDILVDPFISGNPLAKGIVDAGSLKPDVILLTHAHGDHWGDTPEIAKASGALVIGNYEIATRLNQQHGHDHTIGLNIGGGVDQPWGRVTMTHALHSSSFPDGTYGGNPGGFVLEIEGKTLYLAGDTAPFAEMAWIGADYALDIAFIPVGDVFTMGPRSSLRAAQMLKARRFIPIHYNTFPPIRIDTEAWARSFAEAGHHAQVMAPGETLSV
ncbi:MAG: metal-dependent hydrolase [Rhodothermales bacterium]